MHWCCWLIVTSSLNCALVEAKNDQNYNLVKSVKLSLISLRPGSFLWSSVLIVADFCCFVFSFLFGYFYVKYSNYIIGRWEVLLGCIIHFSLIKNCMATLVSMNKWRNTSILANLYFITLLGSGVNMQLLILIPVLVRSERLVCCWECTREVYL